MSTNPPSTSWAKVSISQEGVTRQQVEYVSHTCVNFDLPQSHQHRSSPPGPGSVILQSNTVLPQTFLRLVRCRAADYFVVTPPPLGLPGSPILLKEVTLAIPSQMPIALLPSRIPFSLGLSIDVKVEFEVFGRPNLPKIFRVEVEIVEGRKRRRKIRRRKRKRSRKRKRQDAAAEMTRDYDDDDDVPIPPPKRRRIMTAPDAATATTSTTTSTSNFNPLIEDICRCCVCFDVVLDCMTLLPCGHIACLPCAHSLIKCPKYGCERRITRMVANPSIDSIVNLGFGSAGGNAGTGVFSSGALLRRRERLEDRDEQRAKEKQFCDRLLLQTSWIEILGNVPGERTTETQRKHLQSILCVVRTPSLRTDLAKGLGLQRGDLLSMDIRQLQMVLDNLGLRQFEERRQDGWQSDADWARYLIELHLSLGLNWRAGPMDQPVRPEFDRVAEMDDAVEPFFAGGAPTAPTAAPPVPVPVPVPMPVRVPIPIRVQVPPSPAVVAAAAAAEAALPARPAPGGGGRRRRRGGGDATTKQLQREVRDVRDAKWVVENEKQYMFIVPRFFSYLKPSPADDAVTKKKKKKKESALQGIKLDRPKVRYHTRFEPPSADAVRLATGKTFDMDGLEPIEFETEIDIPTGGAPKRRQDEHHAYFLLGKKKRTNL